MFNKKGTTLIESLLAFEIFISVCIVYVGLFSTLLTKEKQLQQHYQQLMNKEGDLQYSQDYIDIIEEVLH